jgi:ubiquinol-cytochrome c reductase cytochrome c1 subunit
MRSLKVLSLGGALALAASSLPAFAQEMPQPAKQDWSFYGPFGTYDRASLQRGFQIYREVCAACHSMNMLAYHDLSGIGYDAAQIKAIAASVQIPDTDDTGQPADRPGLPSDRFKAPFPNEKAARAGNNGAVPPDQSLLSRGREGGPDYIYALMTSYKDTPPAGVKMGSGMYYNDAFPGHQIAMPPPLSDDRVSYADGTKATIAQEAKDVATFLAWTSDPHLEDRHRIGARVIIFLVALSGVMYGVKRKIWSQVEH